MMKKFVSKNNLANVWKKIRSSFLMKGEDPNQLVQSDGNPRPIYDNDELESAGVGTQIPTIRAIKLALQKYQEKEGLDLSDYITSDKLLTQLANVKSEILGGAGEDYDTLKEIEEWINTHQDLYQGLLSAIAQRATKDEIKDMASKPEVDQQIEALRDELGEKVNVVVCDGQYDFDNIKTKDPNTIYLIKGDQDVWAAKDYVDELFDLLVDLRSRVTVLEAQTMEVSNE